MSPNIYRKKKIKLVLIAVLLGLLTQSGCKVDNQKAEDSFSSGKLPSMLFKLANQQYSLNHYKKLIQAGIDKEKVSPSLPFVVIDNGVDLAHPDLIKDILFKVDAAGNITAGYDPMGGDAIASSVLIDPKLYAFAADDIIDGKISGADKNPLDLILSLNSQFIDELISEISKDPVLSKSLFSKISKNSLSIFGAHRLLSEEKFDSKQYSQLKAKNQLMSLDMRSRKSEEIEGKVHFSRVHYTLDEDWDMSRSKGLPKLQGSAYAEDLWRIEHADKFSELLERVMAKHLSGGAIYAQGIENMLSFLEGRIFDASQRRSKKVDTILEVLNEALYFKLHSYRSFDPIHDFNEGVKKFYITMKGAEKDSWRIPVTMSSKEMTNSLQSAVIKVQQFLKNYSEIEGLGTAERLAGEDMRKNMGTLLALIDYYLQDRQWSQFNTIERESQTPQSSLYRNFLIKTNHPFLHSKSATVTHGTHVTETVAAGHEGKVKAVPVRVTTQGIAVGSQAKVKLKNKFYGDFSSWLEDPLVYTAVVSKYNEVMGAFEKSSPNSSADIKKATIKKILQTMRVPLEFSFEENVLDYNFFNEIISAIIYTGKNKIPVGNISLGTNFEKTPASVAASSNPEVAAAQLFEFLRFEFFKYRIGETVVREAPGTLFHVASGNDGKWIDGESRSALPVDVSSPFLREFETDTLKAPNNHLNNIIAVGSIDPKDKISSFTNIPISANTPFVLGHGERILSAIKTTDLSSIEQVLTVELPFLQSIENIDTLSEVIVPLARSIFLTKDEIDLEKSDSEKVYLNDLYAKQRLSDAMSIFSSFTTALAVHLFQKHPNHRATLTGTSMATPTVLNIVIGIIIQKAEAQGLALNEVYNRPGFRPQEIVNEIFSRVTPMNPGSKGVLLSKLIGEYSVPVDSDVQDLEKLLRSMKTKSKASKRVIQECSDILLKDKDGGF